MPQNHVFVLEDDAPLRASLKDLLTGAGYIVRSWSDAESFLECVPDLAPAVILTDMRMPVISGVQMHNALLARGYELPVIYISGESSLQEGVDAMKLGAVEFLLKPFGRAALLDAVARGLVQHRAQRSKARDNERIAQAMTLLTPREQEVMLLMLKGYSNLELINTLGISLPTAKQYKTAVMRKLGVRTLSQLMSLYGTERSDA